MDPSIASHKAMDAHSLEDILACTKSQELKVRPQQEQPLACPRCESTNTKFCYYNNYSLSQPRYFCKGCKRYWTQGGALRNVPVGGGCRKNKRPSSTAATSTTVTSSLSCKTAQDQIFIPTDSNRIPTLPLLTYDPNDLTLVGFSGHDTNTISFDDILGIPKSTFLDTQCGISYNNYNGVGNDDMGEVVSGAYEEMRSLRTTKQEPCGGREGEIDRRFWNLSWQSGGDASLGGLDSGREYWNGFESSWKGLINSTLM